MRKCVLMVVAVLAVASVSFAQSSGKISTVWKCAAPNPVHALPVGDVPDHIYAVEQGKCTAASGEIAGVKQKEGIPTEFLEGTATGPKGMGFSARRCPMATRSTIATNSQGLPKTRCSTPAPTSLRS